MHLKRMQSDVFADHFSYNMSQMFKPRLNMARHRSMIDLSIYPIIYFL